MVRRPTRDFGALSTDEVNEELLSDPARLVDNCNFGGAVGTWNANGTASWCAGGNWIIADVALVQEQADDDFDDESDYVDLIFAMWSVDEGTAYAVWSCREHESLASVMGLPGWPPEGWTDSVKVWYGE